MAVQFETCEWVTKNNVVALALYNMAAAKGNQMAIDNKNQLVKNLTTNQTEAAQKLTKRLSDSSNFFDTLSTYFKGVLFMGGLKP